MKKAQSFVAIRLLGDSEVIPVAPGALESRITRERLEYSKCMTSKQTLEEQIAVLCGQSLKGGKSKGR